jgi:hypothetical protein
MSIYDTLYSFAFKGLLTEEALDKTERKSIYHYSEIADMELAKRLCLSQLDEELVRRAKRMSIVYTAIAGFENSAREFATKILIDHYGANWWNESVPEKIRIKALARRDEEAKTRWHTSRGENLIQYIDFDDLFSIISNSQNWHLFEPHLASIEWSKSILKSLEKSRNIIMHSGELSREDIERIGTNIRDWIRQVGS